MKLRECEQPRKRHDCYVRRKGGSHTIYTNPAMASRRRSPGTRKSRPRRCGSFVTSSMSWRRSLADLPADGDRLADDAALTDTVENLLAIHFEHQFERFFQVRAGLLERLSLRDRAGNFLDESRVTAFFGRLINRGERLRHGRKLTAYLQSCDASPLLPFSF